MFQKTPVRVENLGPGSPLNKLFNDFFVLNKNVMATPVNYRDEGFWKYANQQITSFTQNNQTVYGRALAEAFANFLKKEPFKVLSFDKTSAEFGFFQRFWQLHKKYINGETFQCIRSDKYWEFIEKEVNEIYMQYKESMEAVYCVKILSSFLDELERRDREEKGSGGQFAHAS